MKPTRIYLAGPMTGKPDLNFPAFHHMAAQLRSQGFEVVNPAEVNPDQTMPWEECMRRDIAELVRCDYIYLLPGWEQSKGATLEHHIADRLGMGIMSWSAA
jgi:nucleoside 2-deoxyribosyltransferase